MSIHKAVIPVAGYGTRMLPAAKAIPKEMLPILDRPAIQYIVEEAAGAGAMTFCWSPAAPSGPSRIISTAIRTWKSSHRGRQTQPPQFAKGTGAKR
jgi:hypothetical protein